MLVALVSEVFVESVQKAAETFGMSQVFVGFIVVALVGGAAEMAVAFCAENRGLKGSQRRARLRIDALRGPKPPAGPFGDVVSAMSSAMHARPATQS